MKVKEVWKNDKCIYRRVYTMPQRQQNRRACTNRSSSCWAKIILVKIQ